jgi:protease IV
MNTNFENNQNINRKRYGCLFAIMAFLSSCFVGIIIIAVVLFFLISNSFKNITGKPCSPSNSFTQTYYSGNNQAKNKIALIKINGIIMEGDTNPWSSTANANNICKKLTATASDKNIKAVIIEIDSPGGEITATDKIYHYVQKIKKANKPVIAILESVAASGGYYVAAGADYIIANRLTTTGSIGVLVNTFNFHKLLKKIGISDEVYKSKEMKDFLNPARPRTIAEKKIIQTLVNESYNEFVNIVSKGRISKNSKLTPQYIKSSKIGDGRIFSGSQALKLGLIDKLGYLETAEKKAVKMAHLENESYKIITYKENLSLADIFQKFMLENFSLKVNIPGITQYDSIKLGKFYYLYNGF